MSPSHLFPQSSESSHSNWFRYLTGASKSASSASSSTAPSQGTQSAHVDRLVQGDIEVYMDVGPSVQIPHSTASTHSKLADIAAKKGDNHSNWTASLLAPLLAASPVSHKLHDKQSPPVKVVSTSQHVDSALLSSSTSCKVVVETADSMDIDVVIPSILKSCHLETSTVTVSTVTTSTIHPLYVPEILEHIFSFLEGQIITGFNPDLPLDFVKSDSIKYTISRPKLHGAAMVNRLWNQCARKHLWKNVKIGNIDNCSQLGYVLAASSASRADLKSVVTESFDQSPLINWNRVLPVDYGRSIRSISLVPPHTCSGIDFEDWNIDNVVSIIALTCPKLEDLNLANCFSLTDKPMIRIAQRCPKLKKLNLNRCDLVTDLSLYAFAENFTQLEMLNLSRPLMSSRTHLSDRAMQAVFAKNPLLKEVRIRNCEMTTDSTLIQLGKTCGKSMRALDLSWCVRITDSGIINGIGPNCTNLISLSLNGCKLLTDAALFSILSSCPSIQSLSLAHLPAIQDVVLSNMAERLQNLRILSLNGCSNIRDASIVALARNCPQLQSLSLFTLDITDQSVIAIAHFCPNLSALSISGCRLVTDVGASHISKLPLITSLYLNGAKITDKTIISIAHSCRKIRALSLNECTALTDQSAAALATFSMNLQSLSMNYCGISNCGVRAVVERCQDLREISVRDCPWVDLVGAKSTINVTGNGGMNNMNAVGALVYQYIESRRIGLLMGNGH
eukprot:Partr_v1_DN27286_c0_g1_i2_m38760 putative F-box and leucine-rich repeat protein 7